MDLLVGILGGKSSSAEYSMDTTSVSQLDFVPLLSCECHDSLHSLWSPSWNHVRSSPRDKLQERISYNQCICFMIP